MNLLMHQQDEQQAPLLVSEPEAARLLNVSPRTVHTLRKRGELPYVPVGHLVKYSVEDLQKWVREQSRRDTGSTTTADGDLKLAG